MFVFLMFCFMSKILLTGVTGFVGANLARRLLRDKHEVHAIARSPASHWRIAELSDAQNFFLHHADLRNFDEVSVVIEEVHPQHIMHLAVAGIYEGRTGSDENFFETNTLGLVHLLQAAKEIPYESFINTGSSSEYGITQKPMEEGDSCKPANVYGVSKLAATYYASLHATQFQKPVITLRLFSPYGPYDFGGRFIVYAVLKSLRGEALQLGNPDSRRDFVYVEDVVEAYRKGMEQAHAVPGEVYNIASGLEVTVKEAAVEIQRICGSKAPISWGSAGSLRPGESPRWQGVVTKAKQDLQWEPRTSFADGLEKTANWFRINASLYNI